MSISGDKTSVVVAGATGLIGHHVMKLLIDEPAVDHIYALSRRALDSQFDSNKLHTLIHSDLQVTSWDDTNAMPNLGVICLGTTKKKAGSKEALRKIDVELVSQVAQSMKFLGVQRVAVVSSYGASPDSYSHYLRCKGQMEQNLKRIGFKQLFIARPGPLVGERDEPRADEKLLQSVFPLLSPFMFGKFKNLRPIQSKDVAKAILFRLFENNFQNIEIYSSSDMLNLLAKYR
ncbi:putative nucleoside-diphosphate-sugar epimerase [Vibrio coralliirubri]|uniref:NAD-dependent epimerase/dehydratase family protein n=1 Tax=Vibrio coralliirubri TaxID=1516159 RepID=UPI0006389EFC|nr:NAD-dependent epimerase/dehydratase family protein [Vibrio coralliirubri]CDT51288.1 putative nucleoside-diphosphate-sugar epimerase [Vibrio coralliirubri]